MREPKTIEDVKQLIDLCKKHNIEVAFKDKSPVSIAMGGGCKYVTLYADGNPSLWYEKIKAVLEYNGVKIYQKQFEELQEYYTDGLPYKPEKKTQDFNPDWKGDPDDPNRWKGW